MRGRCLNFNLDGHTLSASSWGVGVLSLMAVEYKEIRQLLSRLLVTCPPFLHVPSSSHPSMLTASVGRARHAPLIFNDFPCSSRIQNEVSFGC
jgi:hypothetical protein